MDPTKTRVAAMRQKTSDKDSTFLAWARDVWCLEKLTSRGRRHARVMIFSQYVYRVGKRFSWGSYYRAMQEFSRVVSTHRCPGNGRPGIKHFANAKGKILAAPDASVSFFRVTKSLWNLSHKQTHSIVFELADNGILLFKLIYPVFQNFNLFGIQIVNKWLGHMSIMILCAERHFPKRPATLPSSVHMIRLARAVKMRRYWYIKDYTLEGDKYWCWRGTKSGTTAVVLFQLFLRKYLTLGWECTLTQRKWNISSCLIVHLFRSW